MRQDHNSGRETRTKGRAHGEERLSASELLCYIGVPPRHAGFFWAAIIGGGARSCAQDEKLGIAAAARLDCEMAEGSPEYPAGDENAEFLPRRPRRHSGGNEGQQIVVLRDCITSLGER